MIINDIELENLDFFDADVAKRYEKAIKKMQVVEENTNNKDLSLADIIKRECQLVFDFFNDVFGEGTDKKIFEERKNYKECIEAYKQFMDYAFEQGREVEKMTAKYSPNRATRRGK